MTVHAEADLREARSWSRARWGTELTDRYFQDLHESAQSIAANHASLRSRHELACGTPPCLYPVREHYIVYEPLTEKLIAIVAMIRQRRDIPAILQKWAAPIPGGGAACVKSATAVSRLPAGWPEVAMAGEHS